MLGILAYALVSATKIVRLANTLKICTYTRSLIDDFVVAFDEIVKALESI